MIACQNGNLDATDVLLNAGADPHITDTKGDTWIHHAVIWGCKKETLRKIIDHGADVNATNKNSVKALMIACEKGNVDAMNVLLNAGADPNITDTDGETWIHHASSSKETLQAIIIYLANVIATNENNIKALMKACNLKI